MPEPQLLWTPISSSAYIYGFIPRLLLEQPQGLQVFCSSIFNASYCFVHSIIYSVTFSHLFYPIAAALTTLTAIVVAVVRPYKSSAQNTLDTVLLHVLGLSCLSGCASNIASHGDFEFIKVSNLMIYAVAVVPLVYLFALLFHTLICHKPATKRILRRALMFATNGRSRTDSLESLPHRIDHAEEYATLEFPSEATYGSIDSTPTV